MVAHQTSLCIFLAHISTLNIIIHMEDTIALIKETLDKVRPFINRDGGDVEFVDFIDGIVYINMQGACQDCMLIDSTISDGIEIILQEEVPGVIGVKLASEMPKKEENAA